MRRAAVTALVATTVLGGLAWWFRAGSEFRLPERMRIEQVVADLTATAERAAESPVRVGESTPAPDTAVNGGQRRALLAPPPAVIRLRTPLPPHARLRLAFAVALPDPPIPDGRPVRFTVTVDGRQILARDVDPTARKYDRGWLEQDVDLGDPTGGEVELVLATSTTRDGAPVGTPAWGRLRLVREEEVARQPAAGNGPSVLVLLIDTLRADRLGCYGAAPSPSSNLDRLAESGRIFENAVAQSSWTVPSVATLFTGLHPRSHGVWGAPHDAASEAETATFLPDGLVTMARAAQEAGITTFGVSANPLVSRGTNFAQGFETFVEFGLERRFGTADRNRNWASAADVNARFTAWLQRNRHDRFLAYLHYMEPHDPYTPPDAPAAPPGVRPPIARGDVYPMAQKLNWHGGDPLLPIEIAHLRALYDGEIRAWDAQLGVLLKTLDELAVRESAVIIVTADHGEEFQEHGKLRHGVNLYEETIHVPLVVAGAGIGAGRVATQVQGIDLFPTVAALLRFPPPAGAPGRNVLGDGQPRPALSELAGGLVAVRADGWKLVAGPGGQRELYDLRSDAHEHINRIGTAPQGDELTALLAGWQAPPPPTPVADGDPRIQEKLRALGYVE